MSAVPLADTARLCVHTITTRPWTLAEAVAAFSEEGVSGISIWREALAGRTPEEAGRLIRGAGLRVVSLCRGGFFPAREPAARRAAIDENRRVIDEAARLGAPQVILVCGAVPGLPLADARAQIADGIAAVLPDAERAGVRLAIEPLHPMYADDRSAVNTVGQALALCRALGSPAVGIAVDVYHVWWDPDLEAQVAAAGAERRLFAFHVCDWRTPTRDLLNDRVLMGEGCIPIRAIRGFMERAGFAGDIEVEIFSTERWAGDQRRFLREIRRAYLEHV